MHRYVLLLIDLIVVAVSSIFSLILRDNLEVSADRMLQLLPYLLLTLLAATPVLLVAGLNRTLWRFSSLVDYLRVVAAVVATVLLAVALSFLLNRLDGVARALPILQGLLMACGLVSVRLAMRLRHATRHRGARTEGADRRPQETVLVVGINTVTELFLRSLEEFAGERVKVEGLLGRGDRHRGRLLRRHRVLGIPEELEKVLGELEVHGVLINRIVITTKFSLLSPAAQEALLRVERTSDIQLDFFAERVLFNETNRPKPKSGDVPPKSSDEQATAPLTLDPAAIPSQSYFWWKRTIDVAAATAAIVCLSPVILLVGLVAALDAGPPAIFWQRRPGARGWPFKLYKFRTMRAAYDAEGRRIADAERATIVGHFLRRTRLDELPQLYNILVGEMSFVGPRPLLPADQMPGFDARHSVRPGLTGWAQIKGGRELTAADKAALDVWYVRNASLRLDLAILLGTLRLVLFGERTDRETIHRAWRELRQDPRDQERWAQHNKVDEAPSLLHKDSRGKLEEVSRLTAQQASRACSTARNRA